jgi:hypothetical protein
MPKPKKTASFFYFTEWLQHFLIRSKLLFPDDFHQYALAPAAVKFAVENLFPRAEVRFSLCDGHNDFAAHDLPFLYGRTDVFIHKANHLFG